MESRRIKLTLEYDGTNYAGWQVQTNAPTVQAAVEAALARLTGESLRIQGASRTDSGVHARGQVAAFNTTCNIPLAVFAEALNTRLPADIAAVGAEEVPAEFDPRRRAVRKQYNYVIRNSPLRRALDRHQVWTIRRRLDREAMRRAAEFFLGTHDFTSFSNGECADRGEANVRTIDRSELLIDGDLLTYVVEGRSFLYNMVRAIAGTLVDVGAGRFAPEAIPDLIARRDRQAAGQGAPPHGLCLMWIKY